MNNRKLTKGQWVQLIERVQNDDTQAFEELCRLKTPSILFVCNDILHSWEDAEDATQEVLILLKNNIKKLTTPEAFPTWLNRLTLSTCFRMRHKQMHEQFKLSLDEAEIDIQDWSAEALPLDLLVSKESQWRVMEAIESLPYHFRMPIILFYYEGMKIAEISEVLDMTQAVVKNNLQRGKQALKVKLEKEMHGDTYTKFSVLIPFIINKTEMLVAQQHSANVLKAMGIPTTALGAPVTTAITVGKVVGAIAASSVLAASIWFAVVPCDTPNNMLGIAPQASPTALSPNMDNDAPIPSHSNLFPALSDDVSSSELAPQLTQSQTASERDKENPVPSLPNPIKKGAAVMGRIYIDKQFDSNQPLEWSVPGITVQLFSAKEPNRLLKTTQTMQGEYDGWYLFEGLEPGEYIIKPILPSYLSSAADESTVLENGRICQNGKTVYSVKADQVLTLHLPVAQQGNISGQFINSSSNDNLLLSGIKVKLYNVQNCLIMETTSDGNGNYTFASPPVTVKERYTLRFLLPSNSDLALAKNEISFMISPGENIVLENIDVQEVILPDVSIIHNGSAVAPIMNREDAFRILVAGADPATVVWEMENCNQVIVATGNSLTPGNQLDAIPAGDYFLTVTVSCNTNSVITIQKILYLG